MEAGGGAGLVMFTRGRRNKGGRDREREGGRVWSGPSAHPSALAHPTASTSVCGSEFSHLLEELRPAPGSRSARLYFILHGACGH